MDRGPVLERLFGVLRDRWSEQLVVYPKTNKQNQKKKRKVEPATTLVRSPMACATANVDLVGR